MKTNDSPSSRLESRPTILLVDDVKWFREELAQALAKRCGARVLQAAHGLEALRALERNPQVTAIVADYRFENGGPDGVMILESVGKRWPTVKRMLLSAYSEGWMYERGHADGYTVRDKALPISELAKKICEWLAAT